MSASFWVSWCRFSQWGLKTHCQLIFGWANEVHWLSVSSWLVQPMKTQDTLSADIWLGRWRATDKVSSCLVQPMWLEKHCQLIYFQPMRAQGTVSGDNLLCQWGQMMISEVSWYLVWPMRSRDTLSADVVQLINSKALCQLMCGSANEVSWHSVGWCLVG